MFRFSLIQLFAIVLVLAVLIPWGWRAVEMIWQPEFGQIDIPHRIIQARVVSEDPSRNLVTHEIVCTTGSRLKDGILNLPQAYYPLLTGLGCGIILGWAFTRTTVLRRDDSID